MSGFLGNLRDLYREQMERHRNRTFLRASMAACAMVAMANGSVTLRDRVRVDQVLEALDALKVFDPHEGIELFNEFVEALRRSKKRGMKLALAAVDEEVAEEPEKAGLLIRICLAVSETEEGVPEREREYIANLCGRLGVAMDICPESEGAES